MAQKSTLSDDTIKEPAPTSSTSNALQRPVAGGGSGWPQAWKFTHNEMEFEEAVEKDLGGHKKEPQKSTKAKTERG